MTEQKPPIVSAIIPTRNRPGLVLRAIESVLRQTVSDLEIIVIIDGPDPETELVLETAREDRLRVLQLESPAGGAEARNSGVRAARGEWIAFLDDDDEWLPEKLRIQLEFVSSLQDECPVVCTRIVARSVAHDRIWPRRLPELDEPMSEYLFCRKGFGHGDAALQTSTILTSRSLMLRQPFQAGLKRHQDWDWILRVSADPTVRIHILSEPLSIYYFGDQRQSVGRTADWDFSLEWAQCRRDLITPKAYSFFIATECVPRARKSATGVSVYLRLAKEFAFKGSPRPLSVLLFFLFLLVSEETRHRIRDLLPSKGRWSVGTTEWLSAASPASAAYGVRPVSGGADRMASVALASNEREQKKRTARAGRD